LRTPISGAQFRRDVKRAHKHGKDMATLREIILLLVEGKPLLSRYKDHPLANEIGDADWEQLD
jgi:mRNA-degrading endonuclease YafQ of YafQ-DinJ toxin-antitoxin module